MLVGDMTTKLTVSQAVGVVEENDCVDKADGPKTASGIQQLKSVQKSNNVPKSAVLHRHLHHDFLELARGEGHYLILNDGRRLFDASGGAAVACVGVSSFPLLLVVSSNPFTSLSVLDAALRWNCSTAMPKSTRP